MSPDRRLQPSRRRRKWPAGSPGVSSQDLKRQPTTQVHTGTEREYGSKRQDGHTRRVPPSRTPSWWWRVRSRTQTRLSPLTNTEKNGDERQRYPVRVRPHQGPPSSLFSEDKRVIDRLEYVMKTLFSDFQTKPNHLSKLLRVDRMIPNLVHETRVVRESVSKDFLRYQWVIQGSGTVGLWDTHKSPFYQPTPTLLPRFSK